MAHLLVAASPSRASRWDLRRCQRWVFDYGPADRERRRGGTGGVRRRWDRSGSSSARRRADEPLPLGVGMASAVAALFRDTVSRGAVCLLPARLRLGRAQDDGGSGERCTAALLGGRHGREPVVREWRRPSSRRGRGPISALPERSGRSALAAGQKGWRWVGEMDEIASTFAAAGLQDGFHRAAAEVYRRSPKFGDVDADEALDRVVEASCRPFGAGGTGLVRRRRTVRQGWKKERVVSCSTSGGCRMRKLSSQRLERR